MAQLLLVEQRSDKSMLSTDTKLNELVNRLKEVSSANLQSVILYGSAARGGYHPDHSDLNVFCVLGSLSVEELGRMAPAVRWWVVEQKEPAPLFFTAEELQQSADVFSIELRDIKDSRRVLFGSDPIANLKLPINLHRVQVEHELRTVLLKLRNAYFRSPGDPRELTPVLRKSFSSVLTLLRHVIIASGEEPPAEPRDVIRRATALTHSNASAFETILRLREHTDAHVEITQAYGAYLAAVESVIRALDQHLPKEQWQRTRQANS
ncbi:MAG TPA: nucleotidyltransferase domain-containing protein [Candidatus Acidoferrum sp.]|nr:nucleotidyltransferase domain-containing protein [Candidatus Acidoferrum sp.]